MKIIQPFHSCFLASIILFAPVVGLAQDNGIKFDNDLSWSAILTKAKTERKFVFMDCYTTWCAPCKYMSQNIFTQKPVGDFFNTNFINVSVQLDRTSTDSESVREWYVEADTIAAQYAVNVYPTYLIFSPDGVVLDRIVGGFEANELIARVRDALVPEKQYYTLVNQFKEHMNDSGYLRNALLMALKLNDNLYSTKIADYYFATLKDPFSIDNVNLLASGVHSCSSQLFEFFMRYASKIDTVVGAKNKIENMLSICISDERLVPLFKRNGAIVDFNQVSSGLKKEYPTLVNQLSPLIDLYFSHSIKVLINKIIYKSGAPTPDWETITREMCIQYPGYDCKRMVAEVKPEYYKFKKMWPQCAKSALSIFNHYGDKLDAHKINNIVWDYLFMHSFNIKILRIALKWSKRSVDMAPGYCEYLDTYANLLYKIGDYQNALQWEKKAFECSGVSDDEIRSNFEKMKRGERTWPAKDDQKK